MKQKINLILATETNAEHIHQMQYESFLPLYEKYHDDETNYFLIEWQQQIVGAVRVVKIQITILLSISLKSEGNFLTLA